MSGFHSFGNDASRRADKIGLVFYNAKPDPTNYRMLKSKQGASQARVTPFYPPPPDLDCTNLLTGELAFSLGSAPQNQVEQEVRTSLAGLNAEYETAPEEYRIQLIKSRITYDGVIDTGFSHPIDSIDQGVTVAVAGIMTLTKPHKSCNYRIGEWVYADMPNPNFQKAKATAPAGRPFRKYCLELKGENETGENSIKALVTDIKVMFAGNRNQQGRIDDLSLRQLTREAMIGNLMNFVFTAGLALREALPGDLGQEEAAIALGLFPGAGGVNAALRQTVIDFVFYDSSQRDRGKMRNASLASLQQSMWPRMFSAIAAYHDDLRRFCVGKVLSCGPATVTVLLGAR